MLAENYLYTIGRADYGLDIYLVHKCGSHHLFKERRNSLYQYQSLKSIIRFMESMTDDCCDQFLNCCKQQDEAKKRAKEEARLAAQAKANVGHTQSAEQQRDKEQARLRKAERASAKAARRAEKLKQRDVTTDDTPLDHQDSI